MLLLLNGAQFIVPSAISFLIILIFAFAYHELAHAVTADRLGDPTPRRYGRITLNPFANLDKMGMILALIIGFGYAFTPINPNYLRGNIRRSFAIVAVAGPLTNLLMAFLFGLPLRLGWVAFSLPGDILPSAYSFLTFGVYYNLLLFAFNLIPVPPLDGFRILIGLVPVEFALKLEGLYRYSQFIFLGIFFLLPVAGINVIGYVLGPVLSSLYPWFTGGFAPLLL